MIKQIDRMQQRNFLIFYALTYSLYYARSVTQVNTPKCAPQKRRGDTFAATAAVGEPSNLAAYRRHTQRAMLRMAYPKEMPARPQSRRVKRLRGRDAETIILQGENPLMQEREYRPKLMSNGAYTMICTVYGGGGAGKLTDAQSAEPAGGLPRKLDRRLLPGEDARTADSPRETLTQNRAGDNPPAPFAVWVTCGIQEREMSKILTRKGATVNQGTQIGLVGSTGYSTGPHLHFTMYKNGAVIDPRTLIR